MLEVGAMTAASSLARRGRVRGPLNADDVGAPVRELPDTGRAGPRDRQVDNADVVQRKLRGHVLLRPCPSGGRPTPIIAAITPVSSRGRGSHSCRCCCSRLPATSTTAPGIGYPGVGVAGRQRIFNRAGAAGYRGGAG